MNEASVMIEVSSAIARITLNRPANGNAIDMDTAQRLFDAAVQCDLDPAIRCVVITGRGRLFCAGGDIGEFAAAGEDIGPFLSKLAGVLHMAIARFMRMPKPLLVAVNGPAAGAGMSLALAGDLVLAGTSASFSTAYGQIGLTADGGMSWHLPRLVGMRRAQEMLVTGRRVAAPEALEIGLVSEVIDDERLSERTDVLAHELAARATAAIGRTKGLLLNSMTADLEGQLEAEARAIVASGMGPESREGVTAFLEKRKPDFQSRTQD